MCSSDLEHPWDELLFWSQGEDVELTRRMQQAGIVPAYADSVSLEVIESRNGYIASFEKGNPAPDSTRLGGFAASLLSHKFVGAFVRSNIGQYLVASKLGKVLKSTNFGAWLGRRLMGHVRK